MLGEERYQRILSLVDEKQNISVQELSNLLKVSVSTIRRDLNALDRMGSLTKVFGGATAKTGADALTYQLRDLSMPEKDAMNLEEKTRVAKFAAGLIQPDDFVYVDAGTTTLITAEYINEMDAVYITNSISHAKLLAQKGANVHLLGGELKAVTEALVGSETLRAIMGMHFSIGLFGTNGVDIKHGLTTPEMEEASVKRMALQHSHRKYILCDSTKFDRVSPVTFGAFEAATILTNQITNPVYRKYQHIMEVKEG